jgi:hypothetical protein
MLAPPAWEWDNRRPTATYSTGIELHVPTRFGPQQAAQAKRLNVD